MAFKGQSVHVPCAFSLVEILSVLYSEFLQFDPKRADHPDRDRLVLSKGHGVMALYACFRQIGWLKQEDLDCYFSDGSRLRGLSEADIPGMEATAGSLGHGLPIAVGMALGLKLKKDPRKVYCIVGDGELNEGPMWESILFASHHKLGNLTIIVDANGFQAMGPTESILNLEPLADKFRAFGMVAAECDGNSLAAVRGALKNFQSATTAKALVARTVKGKGVSFMENDNTWHYTRLNAETLQKALAEVAR